MAAEDRAHPLVACGELLIVEVASADVATLEDGRRRGTARLRVIEVLLGSRRPDEELTQEVATASLGRIHGANWSPWDAADLSPGRRYLFAPGGTPSFELRSEGVRFVPRILEALPDAPRSSLDDASLDLDEVRALAAIRSRPQPERSLALRRWVADARFVHPAWGSAAARELCAADPDEAAAVDAMLSVVLRDDVTDVVRWGWAVALQSLTPRTAPGKARRAEALWHILDRGAPPPGEDGRINLHSAIKAVEGLDLARDPREVIPAGCSRRRLLEALEPLPAFSLECYERDRVPGVVDWVRRLPV